MNWTEAGEGCQWNPREQRGDVLDAAHTHSARAVVLVGAHDASVNNGGIQYRLCSACAALPRFARRRRRRLPPARSAAAR